MFCTVMNPTLFVLLCKVFLFKPKLSSSTSPTSASSKKCLGNVSMNVTVDAGVLIIYELRAPRNHNKT